MSKRVKFFLFIGAVLLTLVSAYLIASPANVATGNMIKSPESTPAVSKEPKQQGPITDTTLQTKLESWAKSNTGNYGIAIQEIGGQQRQASYQADVQFVTASTYKLFVVYAILHDIEQGNQTLQSPTSTGLTIEQCIDAMLIRSDNDCGYPVGSLVGWNSLTKLVHSKGFTNTNINNYDASGNTTDADKLSTAQDQANFMNQLVSGKLLSEDHVDIMLSRMKNQIWRERIPAGVPKSVEVADKPGWLPGIQTDTGVVYGPKSTYVISIMSRGGSASQLAEISKLVYEYLNG